MSSHACGFVNSLQSFYKYKSLINQPTESNTSSRSVVVSCVWFCITACKLFTNTKASSLNQPRASHRVISCVWFCKQLANFLQIQTACKVFTNTKASSLNQPRATHCIAVLSYQACVFIQLANFYKYKSIITQPNREQRIASQCCHPMRVVLYYSLQTFYKYKSLVTQPTESIASYRSVVISCVWFFIQLANFLQIQKHHHHSINREQRIASHRCHLMRVVLYYSLQTFYKYNSILTQPTDSNASHRIVVISCVCVCEPILQMFYKIQSIKPEHGIPDFISFMRARNPDF